MLSQFAMITSRLSAMEESQRTSMVSRILTMMEEGSSSASSDDSASLRKKIDYIVGDYEFKGPMKRFFYNLITEEPQDAVDTLYEECGLKDSHPAIDYETKAYNIVMDFGFDGTPMGEFFKNLPSVGMDKAIDELYNECL